MQVALAAMPWQTVYRPSLPLGLLHSLVLRDRPDTHVVEYHGSIRWVEHLLSATGGRLGAAEYTRIADSGVLHGLGDWVFAGSLYGDSRWRRDDVKIYAKAHEIDIADIIAMQPLAAEFVRTAAMEILACSPDVVGLSTTFMQNVPSLALARQLKELNPDVAIIFGGANCDGSMGHALHRNHPFVDYVVRGEAEPVLCALLDHIADGTQPGDVPGVCWWQGSDSVANPQLTRGVPPGSIPIPTFDAWHSSLESSTVREYVSPELVIESSRGCWWGEKHQCTFCGLNGSLIGFRSKPPQRFVAELRELVERYQILDVVTVDNILDMNYLRSVIPELIELDWDLRLHYEIKSNLRTDQVEALASAGVVIVQPGIESLNSRVLKLMDKGVDGATNVRLLRDCESSDITVEWNYLYGFPGETAEDYLGVIDQIPFLVHLQPPSGVARIVLERFSPYFERPELGFLRREPATFYQHVYDVPPGELDDLVYYFEAPERGIRGALVETLEAALRGWQDAYPYSTLIATGDESEIVIDDRRMGRSPICHRLTGWQAEVYRALARPRDLRAVQKWLEDRGNDVSAAQLALWLDNLREHGLVFTDAGTHVALATSSAAQRVHPEQAVLQ
jgi:ribosomal peptide maturation radical SAM protein 1